MNVSEALEMKVREIDERQALEHRSKIMSRVRFGLVFSLLVSGIVYMSACYNRPKDETIYIARVEPKVENNYQFIDGSNYVRIVKNNQSIGYMSNSR